MNFVLVEALTFGLGRLVEAANKFGVTLHLLTSNKDVYFYELRDIDFEGLVIVEMDTSSVEDVVKYCGCISEFCGIINLTDTWTTIVQEASSLMGLAGQNPVSTLICRNKYLLRKALFEGGLSTGSHMLVAPLEENLPLEMRYPVIIKDPSGTGSKNVWFAKSHEDAKQVFAMITEKKLLESVLIETFFSGTLYSIETVSYKGETKVLAVSSRVMSDIPLFMERAISLPVSTNGDLSDVENWIKKVLSCICYTDGCAHTEFIITPNGFEVVEVNPRLGGVQIGEALCQVYGFNIYEALIEMAMDTRPGLFDKTLDPIAFSGQVFIYAPRPGKFKSINEEYIDSNKYQVYPCAKAGKQIDSVNDQSACVGILLSTAGSSESALLDALAAANKLIVVME